MEQLRNHEIRFFCNFSLLIFSMRNPTLGFVELVRCSSLARSLFLAINLTDAHETILKF